MAEELEELWKKLTFTEEEDIGIKLDSRSTKVAREVGKFCAVMKVLSQRSINVDALRKNLRMLWKPNKGVRISELEEELSLVEFGDEKDKKKVLDMCPWSFEKQLVLIQDFEGELTLKEIELKWAPFWVQIYNLPLKSRTKETWWTIGSSLGSVLDVDVSESGVQWSKCLRVRVRIDVTKRLVRGKKITIEGGESKWVIFKYERLPNFCYRCGLLNHALKECTEGSREESRVGGNHVHTAINLADCNPTLEVVGIDPSTPRTEVLAENGKHQTLVGKVGEMEATLGVISRKQIVVQGDSIDACSGRKLPIMIQRKYLR
nr:uncharacterized protein CFP56_64546 [Quercus suber]